MTQEKTAPVTARKGIAPDLAAGLTVALVSIPEGMAYAMVAGVDPVYGLYTGMITTIVASLTGSTSLMIVTITNALALVAGEQLAALQPDDPVRAMFTLTFLVGIFMSTLGFLRMGSVIRFVSREVMAGFIFATALLIVLGQLKDLVGYSSELDANKLVKAFDILRHFGDWSYLATAIGIGAIVALLVLKRSPVARIADVVVIVLVTILVLVAGLSGVEKVGDIASVPSGLEALPMPVLPELSLIPALFTGALAVTVVGLSESSGVGTTYPNPDGSRSKMSKDFLSQGLGNLAGSFFQAMPACGSLSRTGVNASAGAQSRLAGVFGAVFLALVLVLCGGVAELIPMTGLAAVLIVIGFEVMLKEGRVLVRAWTVTRANAVLALITIAAGVLQDLTVAIFTGVILSLLLYAVRASGQIRLVELRLDDDGRWHERPFPDKLDPGSVTVIDIGGPIYFATFYSVDHVMPKPETMAGSTIIFRYSGQAIQSLTSIEWIEEYVEKLHASGCRLMLADVTPKYLEALRTAGLEKTIGAENIFPATEIPFEATEKAYRSAAERPRIDQPSA
jgi:SulP family sulfate permease